VTDDAPSPTDLSGKRPQENALPGTFPGNVRGGLGVEIIAVLGVSLGASAIRSILSFVEKATRPVALSQQTTAINRSVVPDRPWLDLLYQLASVLITVMPAVLALYLMNQRRPRFDILPPRPRVDLAWAVALAAAIGIPGLALYVGARELGVNTTISAASLPDTWWAIPVLVLAATANGLLEEVVVVGYLVTRLRDLGWATWAAVGASALLRGTYHLYQGLGGFVGNAVMGLVFALFFLIKRRLWPLVIAHALLDIVAYVGYTYLAGRISWL